MWWRIILVLKLLVIIETSTQDDANGTETQTKLCCPCPPGVTGETHLAADQMGRATSDLGTARVAPGGGDAARAAMDFVDDCPCRSRDTDSEGASSIFFPNAVRAFGNVMRPDLKEDSKPLLHPEVDLASSVLETLREATDEEYRDALERDAARAASADILAFDDVITDGVPEEARKVVTIVVSPRDMDTDDALPEASHVQETRCIHSPLGNPRASFILEPLQRSPAPQKGIEEILNLPLPSGLLHRQRDSNLAASNVHENIVRADNNLNKILSGIRARTESNVLRLDPKKISKHINNILNNANSGTKAGNSDFDSRDNVDSNINIDSAINQAADAGSENCDIKTNTFKDSELNTENVVGLDSSISPTNDQEIVVDDDNGRNSNLLKSLLQTRNNGGKSDLFPLKNLFKLRDVELVPLNVLKNVPKNKINIPSINFRPIQSTTGKNAITLPAQAFLNNDRSKTTVESDMDVNNSNESTNVEEFANIQKIPNRKVVTNILDAVPSPSESNFVRVQPQVVKSSGIDMGDPEYSVVNSSSETVEVDDELGNDIMRKEGDDAEGSDIKCVENLQLKSSELAETDETDNFEDITIIDDTEGPELESNSDMQFISKEDLENVSSLVDLSDIDNPEDRSNVLPETHHPLKTLDEITRNVLEKLNTLQKSNSNALNSIKHNMEEISTNRETFEEQNGDTDLAGSETQQSGVNEEELRDTNESPESVSFQDLQNMSDSILMASKKHEQTPETTNQEATLESAENRSGSEEIKESDIDNILGINESQSGKSESELKQNNKEIDIEQLKKVLCPSDLLRTSDQSKLEKSADVGNTGSTDLEPLASEPIINILRPTSLTSAPIINLLRPNSKSLVEHFNDFETKLRQNAIVQPTSLLNLDDLNLFRRPTFSIPDISGLNANIPTLDEIRTRVSEILGGLARTAGDDDSAELDSDDFASDVHPVVSTGASSSNLMSILPGLKPLEDINLDIIQLKPLPSLLGSGSPTTNLPGLNLNRYKAKLAVPKTLELKPLNLASTLGNNGGLVGATLSIGPENKSKIYKSKSKSKSNSDLMKTFRGAKNNPLLAEITSNVQKNALTLFNIPKGTNKPILQTSNVMQNVAEDIKSRTKDTIQSIHESLNPSALDDIHNSLMRNANNLLSSGRSNLEKTLKASSPIHSAVDNIRSHTENTIKQLHNTVQPVPRVSDMASALHKNTHSILKSSKDSIDTAVDNLKAQSENTFRNIQQTLDTSKLADISGSIQKTAQNILKSSPITTNRNILGSTKQTIPRIDELADNLSSHTRNTLKNIQQTLNSPSLSDFRSSIQDNTQRALESPITKLRPGNLKSTFQSSTSINDVVDNLKSQSQNTMMNIKNSLNTPSLADVSASVQKHAQNLLKAPAAFTGRDVLEQLQNSASINLSPHAEKIAKDIQKTLKATLKNNPLKDLPPIPHPNDVMQIIADHHEDVNDKLFALHTDLNDRLESLHNDVTDPERLRSILSPPLERNFELFAIPLPFGARSAPSARKSSRPSLQAKQPPFNAQKKQPKKVASKVSTSTPKLGYMRASGNEKTPIKTSRIPSAARSSPTQTKPQIFKIPPIQPFKGMQGIKKPILPLQKNKVTVTFGTTTSRPITVTSKPKVSDLTSTNTNNKRFKPKPKGPIRQPTPWNEWSGSRNAPKRLEPFTSPSRASSVRTPLKLPVKSTSKPKTAISLPSSSLPEFKSGFPTKKPSLKSTALSQGRTSYPENNFPALKRPSPLFSKLSEALKNKQAEAKRKDSNLEMAPAASERLEKVVALEEPLKENVPYKCKMMCVKVDLNEE